MAKYKWNNPELRRRCNSCTWMASVSMVLALVGVLVFPNFSFIAVAFVGIATILMVIGLQAQKKDRKLKEGGE